MHDTPQIADAHFVRIVERFGHNGRIPAGAASQLPIQQRNLLLSWLAHGIIGNGGFHFFLEGAIPGDPHYLMTRDAFTATDAKPAIRAFDLAFSCFPKAVPPLDDGERLAIWERHFPIDSDFENEGSPDSVYLNGAAEIEAAIERYIRSHPSEFNFR